MLAFLLVQGHNMILHHHNEGSHHHTSSHDHDHEHEHEGNSNDKDHVPFHGSHLADFGKVLIKSNHLKQLLIQPPLVAILTQVSEPACSAESPPLIRPPDKECIQTSLISYTVPRRAPPVVSEFA